MNKHLDYQGIYTWYTFIKHTLQEKNIDLNTITNCQNIKDVNRLKTSIKNILNIFYSDQLENKIKTLDEHNKLFLYKFIKLNNEQEYYLKYPNFETRRLFTQFRISDHRLQIEKGRYLKLPREQRICTTCETIEDEKHFLLYCKINENLRNTFFDDISFKIPNFNNFTDIEKLVDLLNPTDFCQVKRTASFIKQSLELRTGDS